MRKVLLLALAFALPALAAGPTQFQAGGVAAPTLSVSPLSSVGAVLPEDANTVSHVIFDGRHNFALQSSTSCVANAVQAPWVLSGAPTCLSDVAVAPDGTTTTDEWTSTNVNQLVFQGITASSGTQFVGSSWMSKANGTGSASLIMQGSVIITSATCGTSDGSPCSVSGVGTITVLGSFTGIGTTPVRGWVAVTYTSANNPIFYIAPGIYLASTGSTRFWGTQVNSGTAVGTYVPTTTVARTSVPVETRPPSTVRSNYVLQSAALDTSPWGLSAATVTANQGPAGYTDLDLVTSSTTIGVAYQILATAVAAGTTGPWTISGYMAAPSGTADGSFGYGFNTGVAVGCTCTRSDGGTCTPISGTINAYTRLPALTTTPTFVSMTCTSSVPVAQTNPIIYGGLYGISTGSILAGRFQLEGGTTATAYIPTTTTMGSVVSYTGTTPFAWTENGAVPAVQSVAAPFIPGRAGAGPFAAANTYQYNLPDWTGDWSMTIVYRPANTTTTQYLVGRLTGAFSNGWAVQVSSGGATILYWWDTTYRGAACGTASIVGAVNVLTVGKSGGINYCKQNDGAAGTVATGTLFPAGVPMMIGGATGGLSPAVSSTIYEVLASTTPYSDALHNSRWAIVNGVKTQQGLAATVTRTTTKTALIDQSVYKGPLITPDANYVSQVYFDGKKLRDVKNNAWTQNGTVPQVQASNGPPSAGPFSATNNYQGPTTFGEWAGD